MNPEDIIATTRCQDCKQEEMDGEHFLTLGIILLVFFGFVLAWAMILSA